MKSFNEINKVKKNNNNNRLNKKLRIATEITEWILLLKAIFVKPFTLEVYLSTSLLFSEKVNTLVERQITYLVCVTVQYNHQKQYQWQIIITLHLKVINML